MKYWNLYNKIVLTIGYIVLVVNVFNLIWLSYYFCDGSIRHPDSMAFLNPYLVLTFSGLHLLNVFLNEFKLSNTPKVIAQNFLLFILQPIQLLWMGYFVIFSCGYMW